MKKLTMQEVGAAALAVLDGDKGKATQAVAVAWAESGGQLDATNTNTNGTTDDGPWQINSIHGYDRAKLRGDLAYSARAMAAVSKGGTDWGPWSASEERHAQYWVPAAEAVGTVHEAGPLDLPAAVVDELDPLGAVADLLGILTSWDTWRRVLYVLGGTVALVAGLALLGLDLSNVVPDKAPTPPTAKE